MKASLRALLSGVIDYAGLFPPAKLPLDEAIRNYARYRAEPESWMLGRFICPASRLAELAPYRDDLFRQGPPFTFSALGRGGRNRQELVRGLEADLEAIRAFQARHWEYVVVDALEIRVPGEADHEAQTSDTSEGHQGGPSYDGLSGRLTGLAIIIDLRKLAPLTPYYEAEPEHNWRSAMAALVAGVAGERRSHALASYPHCRPAGVKLRCGGLTATAFPTPEQVAFTITACRDAGVPLKFTAGLHHPIRRFDASVQTFMHGFLNVFVAGALAHTRGLTGQQVQAILKDEESSDFRFDDDGLSWKDYRASIAEIETARRQFVISFGSCSFDEPRDDLRALGLL